MYTWIMPNTEFLHTEILLPGTERRVIPEACTHKMWSCTVLGKPSRCKMMPVSHSLPDCTFHVPASLLTLSRGHQCLLVYTGPYHLSHLDLISVVSYHSDKMKRWTLRCIKGLDSQQVSQPSGSVYRTEWSSHDEVGRAPVRRAGTVRVQRQVGAIFHHSELWQRCSL